MGTGRNNSAYSFFFVDSRNVKQKKINKSGRGEISKKEKALSI
jgi:hypothetical protein